jgi:hypothetical protein
MAAIAFDPLEYTHQLEASGVPREQAEVHAKTMTTMFLHNLDALVTRDYLDSRIIGLSPPLFRVRCLCCLQTSGTHLPGHPSD